MGQADRHDVLVGMRFGTIDGKPYKKELLDAKIAGSQDYEVRFVRPQETHPAVLTWASWALPRMGYQGLNEIIWYISDAVSGKVKNWLPAKGLGLIGKKRMPPMRSQVSASSEPDTPDPNSPKARGRFDAATVRAFKGS